jgi:hypothetical protein
VAQHVPGSVKYTPSRKFRRRACCGHLITIQRRRADGSHCRHHPDAPTWLGPSQACRRVKPHALRQTALVSVQPQHDFSDTVMSNQAGAVATLQCVSRQPAANIYSERVRVRLVLDGHPLPLGEFIPVGRTADARAVDGSARSTERNVRLVVDGAEGEIGKCGSC